MCGIAGVVDQRAAAHDVAAQLRCLQHRGPDSSGLHLGSGAVLGQTRLRVIDLVTGDPPITNEDHSIAVAANGEIYNFRALRQELARRHHRLRTRGDTEVIAHLAEGSTAVELARSLHGMFAFAVWDNERRRLILGRDRVGKKPLYYWQSSDQLVFGSEIKAVLAHPLVPRQPDADALLAYLAFGYVPTPRTFFAGVTSVPPGHVLTFVPGGPVTLECYWEPVGPEEHATSAPQLSLADAAVEVRSRLEAAVARRLVADVPVGAFLSGGVDSSAIAALMSQVSPSPVRTFTIGFQDDEGFDERPFARLVAARLGTEHVDFVARPDAVDLVERLVWHHDQPFADSSAVPTFLLSELTRRHVTVALSGDGGDELFAGYRRFSAAVGLKNYRRIPASARAAMSHLVSRVPLGDSRRGSERYRQLFLDTVGRDVPEAYLDWVSLLSEDWRADLVGRSAGWETTDYWEKWEKSSGAHLIHRLLLLNLRTYLVDDLLTKVDRMSMAHGLEVRCPFLDHELVEFALRLPPAAMLRGVARKRVLKIAVKDLLPPEILSRRKRGFTVPLNRWFRTELAPYVDARLGSDSARIRSYLRGPAVDRLLAEHRTRTADHGDALWALLTLEVFLRQEQW